MLQKLCTIIIFLVLSACASRTIDLTIIHTNDHHGHYWKNHKGQYGMSARQTKLNELRNKIKSLNAQSLLLSGGDINTGTLESDIFRAEPDFLGMKKLGYDAMAVGNHEFDNSLDTIFWQQQKAGFPFLSANTRWKNGNKKGQRVFDNPLYITKEYKGIKIGIMGLTTKDTNMKASHDDSRKKVYFTPIIDEARDVIKLMKSDGVDFVIVLTHVGHNGTDTAAGDIELASAVDDIDVIVGGHSQEIVMAHEVNNAIIVQAKEWGKYLGVLDLRISKNSLGMVSKKMKNPYELIPINLENQNISEDKKMLSLLLPFYKKAEKEALKVIGKSSGDFNFSYQGVRKEQTALGQVVATSMIKMAKSDISLMNGGGIRGNIEKGAINYRQIHEIHPYGNTIVNVEMGAHDLFKYVEKNVELFFRKKGKVYKDFSGGYPQFGGLKLYLANEKLVKISSFSKKKYWEVYKYNDELRVEGKSNFIVSLTSFSVAGGDGLPDLTQLYKFTDTGYPVDTAIMNLIKKESKNGKFGPDNYKKDALEVINF